MDVRFATVDDVAILASMNQQLIRDEGHRNPMSLEQLHERMNRWLKGEYQAVLFEVDQKIVGYAMFRREPEYIYIRHLFVRAEFRRNGIARNAIHWLRQHVWVDAPRLRIEVLVDNIAGREFWRALGFHDYCVAMELQISCSSH